MPDTPCERCGQRHERTQTVGNNGVRTFATCAGHVTRDRADSTGHRAPLDQPRPCRKIRPRDAAPAWKCENHGGAAPQVKEARARRETERKAAELMRRFGGPVDTTPTEALLDAVKWTAGYVAWLREKVADTQADKATMDGVDEARVPLLNEERALTQMSNVTGKREASVWVDLLGHWHDRLVRICSEAIKAGVEERRVRIAEQQGALVADVIRKILDDLELTPDQAASAGEAVPKHLRLLAG